MAFKKIGSPDPRYLAATDILIGDMSDINYEFLLFDRPIILLANEWLSKNFPDLGIKTDIDSLENAIRRSISNPKEFSAKRKYWLEKTVHKPGENSSGRVIDAILKHSQAKKPFVVILHGNSEVLKTHLEPLYLDLKKREIDCEYIDRYTENIKVDKNNYIFISAHNRLLNDIPFGYKVHVDHGVKGTGTTDLKNLIIQFKKMQYLPNIDLHITEGLVSFEKTKKILGPNSNRAILVGYPKSDVLLELNSIQNKISVCKEFGFNSNKILVTYAPAGKYSYPFKQGASLSNEMIKRLIDISFNNDDINILIKLKHPPPSFFKKVLNKLLKR